MARESVISAKIDPTLKRNVERIFKKLGLTPGQAIAMFYKQVELERGLPFEVRIPNEDTMQAIEDARNRQNLETFNSIDDLFKDLTK